MLFRNQSRALRSAYRRCRPCLESLEDRTLLAANPFLDLANSLSAPLTNLQARLDSAINQATHIPMLPSVLGDIAQARVLPQDVITKLKNALNSSTTEAEAKTKLKEALGPLLGNRDANPAINENDIDVTLLPNGGVRVELRLRKELVNATLPADFKLDLGLSGLPIDIHSSGGIVLQVANDFELAMGFDPTRAGQQFFLDKNARLPGSLDQMTVQAKLSLATDFEFGATVGVLKGVLKDRPNPGSSVDVTAHVNNIGGTGDLKTQLTGRADARLKFVVGFGPVNDANTSFEFPAIGGDFDLNWAFNGTPDANALNVGFNNVGFKLGSFLSDLVRPLVEVVQTASAPLQPLIDILKYPLPGLTDLSHLLGQGDIDLLGIIRTVGAEAAKGYEDLIKLAATLIDITNSINNIDLSGNDVFLSMGSFNLNTKSNRNFLTTGKIDFGDLKKFGTSLTSGNLAVTGATVNSVNEALGKVLPDGELKTRVASTLNKLIARLNNGVDFSFPILDDPAKALFPLLLGEDTVLFRFDANLEAGVHGDGPGFEVFGFGVKLAYDFDVSVHAQFAYDTYGLRQFFGSGKPGDLVNGFYFKADPNVPLFKIGGSLKVTAGATYAVFSFSVGGGVFVSGPGGVLTVKFHDPNNDGKLRFGEMFDGMGGSHLFDVVGKITAGVSISFKVGVTVPFVGFVGVEKEFKIAETELVNLDTRYASSNGAVPYGTPRDPRPVIAGDVNGNANLDAAGVGHVNGDLYLYAGHLSGFRKNVPLDDQIDGDETYFVGNVSFQADGTETVEVTAFGITHKFVGVRNIYAFGGIGNDVFIIDRSVNFKRVELHGGPGNDRLEHYGLFNTVEMFGDEGNDVLVGGLWGEKMRGGLDNDVLIGGDGNDELFGEDGKDTLFGGDGDDHLAGGDGDDKIDTGSGRDFGQGGNGADIFTIYPGIGLPVSPYPVLYGGVYAVLFFEDNSSEDKLVVSGSAGADRYELTKLNNNETRISHADETTFGLFLDNVVVIGFEEIFLDSGKGADQITINDLSGTVVRSIAVNDKEFSKPDQAADTVTVNATANSDTVDITQTYPLIREGYCYLDKKQIHCVEDQFAAYMKVTGTGPVIWTPNVVGDKLFVNTLGGSDQVKLTADPLPLGFLTRDRGTVEVNTGDAGDTVFVGSLASLTTVSTGSGDDNVLVGTLGIGGGDVSGIREFLTLDGGSGSDTFRFDDARSTNRKTGTIGAIGFQGIILGFGMRNFLYFKAMEFVYAFLGSGGNRVTIDQENVEGIPLADPTHVLEVYTGFGADTVNVKRTTSLVSINGERGLDTVNVGADGSVRKIFGALSVTNFFGFSAVNVDNSADPVSRTVILYDRDSTTFNGFYNVISGLAPADINLHGRNLSSLVIRAGNGGNTFRIHDTPVSNSPGGVTTTISTGEGSDQVLVTGLRGTSFFSSVLTSGDLVLNLQGGTNTVTVGSGFPTNGLDAINGRINVIGGVTSNPLFPVLNTLFVLDGAATTGHDYLVDRDFVQRLDKARISYQNVSNLTLGTGTQRDHVIVQDTNPIAGFGYSTSIFTSTGADGDRIDISRTSGTLAINAGGGSVIEVGNALNPLENIQSEISVTPVGAGNFVTLSLNDTAATTPQQLDVVPAILGTSFRRSGAANINVFFSPLGSFQWTGGSGGNTVNVQAQPAAGSTFVMGNGGDTVNIGTAANTFVAGSPDGVLAVIGGTGTDHLFIRDQGTTTPRRYDVGVGQFAGQESHGGISAQSLNGAGSLQRVNFDHVEDVTLNAGSGGNFFKITGSAAATSTLLHTGAGSDTVDVGSSNAAFGAVNSLRDIRGPLTIDGQGGLDQITFNDQGTTSRQIYTLEADRLTRTDADAVANMGPISFTALEAIALNGSGGGSTVFVFASPANSTVLISGNPGVQDTFWIGADHNAILGPISLNGQTADNDFTYYYDYANANPQTYNFSVDPLLPQRLLVERTDLAPVTVNDLNQVIFFSPLVGGSTVNIKGVPAQMLLNMGASNGDRVTLGSLAPNLGGTLAAIQGTVAIRSYTTADAVTLVLDDSGNADMTPKNVRFTPPVSPTDLGDHIEGFAPKTIYWGLGANSSIALLGGAADETFALTSTAFAPAISIDGGGGVNTLDYSAIGNVPTIPDAVSQYEGEGDGDDSVGDNHGTLVNGVSFVDGKVGQAFSFDGVDDYVQVPNAASLESPTISVEAWVNATGQGRNTYILSKGASGVTAASYALYTGGTGGLYFYIFDGLDYAESPDAGPSIWDGNWHHVVGTFDGATVRLYVDGVEIGEGTPTPLEIGYDLPTTNDLFIGSYQGDVALPFHGLIDETAVYNRALNFAEIKALYTGSSGTSSGVVVNLQMGTATGLLGGIARIQNVIGSAGDDILVGDILVGDGGNVLSGGAGRDLLIAGASASTLSGGDGEDLLIGGTTDYDRNAAALMAIMTEWTRTDADYATRVANLMNGTNGLPKLTATTVRSNGGGNTLTGGAGLDFYFANLDLDPLDTLDRDPLTEALVEVLKQ